MLFAIIDFTTAFFLSLPLLLIYFKSRSQQEAPWRWSFPLWLFNYLSIRYFVSDGELFWVVLCWQLLFLWPISLAIYLHLYKKEKKWSFYIGLKKKHVVFCGNITGAICELSRVFTFSGKSTGNCFSPAGNAELEASPDRQLYLINNTIAPSTLLDVADHIAEVRKGQVYASTLPWRSKVVVHQDNWQKEFTYVRFYDGWRLNGLYQESSWENQND